MNHFYTRKPNILMRLLLFLPFLALVYACGGRRTTPVDQPVAGDNKEQLIKNQQMVVQDETGDIDGYISRRGYKMDATPTGLRYMIYHKNPAGIDIKDNNHVVISYNVSLLNGDVIYSSDSIGSVDLQIGHSELASGLQEGLKLMREKEKSIFIIPSHLAYGLTGDGDKIKRYQTIVVDTEVLKVKK